MLFFLQALMSLPLIYGLKHNILIIIIILKHNDMKSCLKKPPKNSVSLLRNHNNQIKFKYQHTSM